MKEIIEDYRIEGFSTKEWFVGAIGAVVFTLILAVL